MTPSEEARSFRVALLDVMERAGDQVVIAAADGDTTGRELVAQAWGAAAYLDGLAAPEGRPIAALLYGSATAFAIGTAGALTSRPLAPLNPRMTTAELRQVIRQLDPSLLLYDASCAGTATPLAADLPIAECPPRFVDGPPRLVDAQSRAPVAILHTSGTTGVPAAVAIDDGAMLIKSAVTARAYEIRPGDRLCTVPPFHHMSGLIMGWSALVQGASICPVPWFSLDLWSTFAGAEPTHVLMVPTMIEMLLRADQLPHGVRVIAYGGSPISASLLRAVLERIPDVRFVQVYGQTEGSPLTKLSHEDHVAGLTRPGLLGAAGRPVPEIELRIDAPDGAGEGEIVATGPHLFATRPGEELHTGDLGRLEDGVLYLVGRRGDKIIRGGENVYPLEVERALEAHAGVREAAVVGVPDDRLGETLLAVVVPTDADRAPSTTELTAYLRERLSGFKVPTHWRTASELPRNASGKLLRRVVVESVRTETP